MVHDSIFINGWQAVLRIVGPDKKPFDRDRHSAAHIMVVEWVTFDPNPGSRPCGQVFFKKPLSQKLYFIR